MRILRFAVLALLAVPTLLTAAPADACRSVSLANPPGWISSAAFVPALGKILVIDPLTNRLLLVSPSGAISPLESPAADRAKLPTFVAPTDDGFLLFSLRAPSLVFLDQGLTPRGESDLRRAAPGTNRTPGQFYEWTVAGQAIVAYGAIRSPEFPGGFELGFLRVPADPAAVHPPEMLLAFPDSEFYVLGYPYLASVGGTAYFLAMDRTAELYKVPPGGAAVALPDLLPEALRTLPVLHTRMTGPAQEAALFDELTRDTMPAGIYGGPDGFLYLLARRPAAHGGTDWSIYRIDPEGNKIAGVGHLATAAKHLTVVPSKEAWYFFERGDATAAGSQTIGPMMVVPSGRLTSLGPAGAEICPEFRH